MRNYKVNSFLYIRDTKDTSFERFFSLFTPSFVSKHSSNWCLWCLGVYKTHEVRNAAGRVCALNPTHTIHQFPPLYRGNYFVWRCLCQGVPA